MLKTFNFAGFSVVAETLEEAKEIMRVFFANQVTSWRSGGGIENLIEGGIEIDEEKVFTYFPVGEIQEEDVPLIYDRKRVGKEDEVASLPIKYARKYKRYLDGLEHNRGRVLFWYL